MIAHFSFAPCWMRNGSNKEPRSKPFHYPELAARVRAVLGRREGRREGPVRVGELTVDPSTRVVRVHGEPVELSNKEFALLRQLAAEPTRVFTKEELLRDVWGFRSLGRTRTLDSHASRLRRKLDPDGCRFVFNCWGVPQRHLFEPILVPDSGRSAAHDAHELG